MPMTDNEVKAMYRRHRYFQQLRAVQNEIVAKLNQQDDFSIRGMKEHIDHNQPNPIAKSTLRRFVNYGRGGSRKYYTRGPTSHTLFAIIDAAGFEFNLRYKKNK